MATNDEIFFEVKKVYGTIAEYNTGWKKLLSLVSWNGGVPRIDLRDWNPEMDHMSRGITLSHEDARKLLEILQTADL